MDVQVAPSGSQDAGVPVSDDQIMTEAGSTADEATDMQTAPSAS